MINILSYFAKTIIVSGALLFYYWLMLRNRSFHGFNRFFLLAIPVLSLWIPALHFTMPGFLIQTEGRGSTRFLLGLVNGGFLDPVRIYGSPVVREFSFWEIILTAVSILISSILLIRLYRSIRYLQDLKLNQPFLKHQGATLYFVDEKGVPFTFFKSIFWEKNRDLDNPASKQILRHELYHVQEWHSLDLIFLELISSLIWFNPFLPVVLRELKSTHEYSADDFAVKGADKFIYAQLLVQQAFETANPLVQSFFKTQIKRRIAMITKTKDQQPRLYARFLIIPFTALLIGLFSFQMSNSYPAHLSKAGTAGQLIPLSGSGANRLSNTLTTVAGPLADSASPYHKVEIEAEYPGGDAAWGQYLFKNIQYPPAALQKGIQGEVVVEFIVNTNGALSDIHAISGPKSLQAESIRVITQSGKWTPALDHGKKVASYKKQPIIYSLKTN